MCKSVITNLSSEDMKSKHLKHALSYKLTFTSPPSVNRFIFI